MTEHDDPKTVPDANLEEVPGGWGEEWGEEAGEMAANNTPDAQTPESSGSSGDVVTPE